MEYAMNNHIGCCERYYSWLFHISVIYRYKYTKVYLNNEKAHF